MQIILFHRCWALFLLVVFATYALQAQEAQQPSIRWEKTYGGSEKEPFGSFGLANTFFAQAPATLDSAGNIYIATTSSSSDGDVGFHHVGADSSGAEKRDIWVLKLKPNGDTLWTQVIGGPGSDLVYDLILTSAGRLMMVGNTTSSGGDFNIPPKGGANGDAYFMRLDTASGQIVDHLRYGGIQGDYFYSVLETSDGGFFIAGASSSVDGDLTGNTFPGSMEGWVLRLKRNGAIDWWHTMHPPANKIKTQLPTYKEDDWLEEFWDAAEVAPFGDTVYAVIGHTGHWTGTSGTRDIYLAEIAQDGTINWEEVFGSFADDDPGKVLPDGQGGYVMNGIIRAGDGQISTPYFGGGDGWLGRFRGFNSQKQLNLGDSATDLSLALDSTNTGKWATAGVGRPDSTELNFSLQLINKNLEMEQEFGWGGSKADGILELLPSPNDSSLILIGSTKSPEWPGHQGQIDLYVAKINDNRLTSLPDQKNTRTFGVFPNPANQWLQVEPLPTQGKLSLHNAAGQTLASKNLQKGHPTRLSVEDLPAGFYILRLHNTESPYAPRKVLIRH